MSSEVEDQKNKSYTQLTSQFVDEFFSKDHQARREMIRPWAAVLFSDVTVACFQAGLYDINGMTEEQRKEFKDRRADVYVGFFGWPSGSKDDMAKAARRGVISDYRACNRISEESAERRAIIAKFLSKQGEKK